MDANKRIILSVSLLVFIDNFGFGLVFPIIPELFLNGETGLIKHQSTLYRDMLYGLTFAIYPLAAFFGNPLFGGLSDRFGRRKVILYALLGLVFSYLVAGIAVKFQNVYLFMLSRAMSGFFAGTYTVANAIVSDISGSAEHKMTYFRWPTLAAYGGLVLGPSMSIIIGIFGFKANSDSLALPFLYTFALSIVNFIVIYFMFRPTYKQELVKNLSLKDNISSVFYVYKTEVVQRSAVSYWLFQFGFGLFVQSISLYLAQAYGYSSKEIGGFFTAMAVVIAVTVLLIQPYVNKRVMFTKQLKWSLLIVGILMTMNSVFSVKGSFINVNHEVMLWVIAVAFYLTLPMATIGYTTYISEKVSKKDQGTIMGGIAQVQSFALFFSGLLIGHLVNKQEAIIFLTAGVSILLGFILIYQDTLKFEKKLAKQKKD